MTALSRDNCPPRWSNPPVYARYSVQLGKMQDQRRITGTHLAPYLRNVDVQWECIHTENLPLMDFSDEDRRRYALEKGDLLVCEGGEAGRTAIWNGKIDECFFQKAIHRLRPTTDQDEPRFFRYFMKMAVDLGLFAISTASTISHLTAEQLKTVRYPAPPLRQQRAIADYLDRETARLDALVAVKVRVLRLLAEKRRALITRAVTRGLDPHAPSCRAHHPRRHPRPRSSRPTPRPRRPLARRDPGALASRAARISFAWDSAGVVSNLRQRASRTRRMGRS